MEPKFSVLMSVYAKDRPAWVCRALDSIFLNTVKPSEVITVIDGHIPVGLRAILNEFSHRYPQIKLCPLAKNGGLGPALAYGLQQCSHELVARMDADDISLPGQKILMGRRFLERWVVTCISLFNRQLTGKKQAFENFIYWILKHNWDSRPLQRNIRQKHSQFPTRDNRERTGKYQAAYKRIQGIAQYSLIRNVVYFVVIFSS